MATTSATMKLTEPAVTDKVGDSIPALAANFGIIDALYPVGTIYQSTKNVNPSTFIGGTWTQLTDRVLVGAGTTFAAGATGGEATHTLTVNELPSGMTSGMIGIVGSGTAAAGATEGNFTLATRWQSYQGVGNTGTDTYGYGTLSLPGAGAAHDNMPPYRAVYMWERTA